MSTLAESSVAAHRRVVDGPILIVEDKASLRQMLRHVLETAGHEVLEADSVAAAARQLHEGRPSLVLTDLRLPDGNGLAVLEEALDVDGTLPVIVMTAYGGVPEAVAAMKSGALDFLAKPIDPDHLRLLVGRALSTRRVAAENVLLKEELAARRGAPRIVGDAPVLRQAIAELQRAAAGETTVLLQGESGTGKELFARTLHALGSRAEGPFVAINCAAIPETLLETELFGYEKGAFTGASARKPGRFELAHRGTLFLDEVGELPLALQAKLLRVVEDRRVERVGGSAPLPIDVRIVAATNRHLKSAVTARRFREDLFFRLSVFPITVPPLRERRGDIARLAGYFAERFCRDLKRPPLAWSSEAIEALEQYAWPGNVRELQNCIERTVILIDEETIRPRHLHLAAEPPAAADTDPSVDPWAHIDLSGTMAEASARLLTELERRKLAQALAESGGDRRRMAEALQMTPRALELKLRELGLDPS